MEFWEWCDDNLDDVDFDGDDAIVSLGDRDSARDIIDEHTGITGMAEALQAKGVDWIDLGDGSNVRFKKFRRHNGKTAKERASDNRKKANQRSGVPHVVPVETGQKPGPEQRQSRADLTDTDTALCIDRGVQGGKTFEQPPPEFVSSLDDILKILQVDDQDQIGFLARLAWAVAAGFEFPKPLWDYIGRAKGTRKKPIRNPAAYLTDCLRSDLGPGRWRDFLNSTPSPAHCQAILSKQYREAV
jgi:hypothetical protein